MQAFVERYYLVFGGAAVMAMFLAVLLHLHRRARKPEGLKFGLKATLTPAGYMTYAILIFGVVAGIAVATLLPRSPVGSLICSIGLVAYVLVWCVVIGALQILLYRIGLSPLHGIWEERRGKEAAD